MTVAPLWSKAHFRSLAPPGTLEELLMISRDGLTRRGFVGGVAPSLGLLTVRSPLDLFAESPEAEARRLRTARSAEDPYDLLAKLHYNENPYGPPESVLKAMTQAFKYANR